MDAGRSHLLRVVVVIPYLPDRCAGHFRYIVVPDVEPVDLSRVPGYRIFGDGVVDLLLAVVARQIGESRSPSRRLLSVRRWRLPFPSYLS